MNREESFRLSNPKVHARIVNGKPDGSHQCDDLGRANGDIRKLREALQAAIRLIENHGTCVDMDELRAALAVADAPFAAQDDVDRQLQRLRTENARLKQPVTDEEWSKMLPQRSDVDALLASRSKEPEGEQR